MLTAVAFLTRIPVPGRGIPNLNRAAVYFPLVGLLVGAIAAATRALADQVLQPLPATVLAVAAAIIVTGALHEDGLADVADALGAHTTQHRRREILKDPRVGTMGALALILAVGLSTTTLASLDTEHAAKAL
ncbi:MAG TPA: adenosylcobinamide-GDP ribazoletransferase, partial [Solirubrobacter sp.]